MKRVFIGIVIACAVVDIGLQLVPLSRTNPPVTREVRWNAPETRALAQRACFDCHSNLTVWPWYSHVAPVSLFVVNHVSDGRRRLNFSTWDQPQRAKMEDVEDQITRGEMPIDNYTWMHPASRLTPDERRQLIDGLRATFLADPPIPRGR